MNKAKKDEFPGLFCSELADQCWIDDQHVLCAIAWRSIKVIVSVNTESGKVQLLSKKLSPFSSKAEQDFSWNLFYVKNGKVLVTCRAPNFPTFFVMGQWKNNSVDWVEVSLNGDHPMSKMPKFDEIRSIRFSIEPLEGMDDGEMILIQPPISRKEKSPLVVFPHGIYLIYLIYFINFNSNFLFFIFYFLI